MVKSRGARGIREIDAIDLSNFSYSQITITKNHGMPTVRVKSDINLGLQEILTGISELETQDLERFMDQVGKLLTRRKAVGFSGYEAELLLKINQGLPQKTQD